MNITLTGASGFIGGALVSKLKGEGHQLHILGRGTPRDSSIAFSKWDANGKQPPPVESIADADAIIHLAGEPVALPRAARVTALLHGDLVEGAERHRPVAVADRAGALPWGA